MSGTGPDDIVRISLPTPFTVITVNAFLVKRDPLTLVDTGAQFGDSYERLVEKLREHGVEVKDLEVILLTHGHIDHMGQLGRILENSNAQAYAHAHAIERSKNFEQADRDNLAFYETALREFGAPEPQIERVIEAQKAFGTYAVSAPLQNAVHDGDAVGEHRVYFVPGHSSSDVLYVDEGRRIAFTGDHVLKGITPNPFLRRPAPGQPRPKSLLEYVESLRRTRSLDLDVCYPGHGSPIPNHREIIDNLLQRTEDRTTRVAELLDTAAMTPYEVCTALFPKLDPKQLLLGLSVAVGHLEVLEERGMVQRVTRDGVVYFYRTPA